MNSIFMVQSEVTTEIPRTAFRNTSVSPSHFNCISSFLVRHGLLKGVKKNLQNRCFSGCIKDLTVSWPTPGVSKHAAWGPASPGEEGQWSSMSPTSLQHYFSLFNLSVLSDPMDRSSPGLPVLHQLPEFTQTHVHRVGDAIQPPHPLSSPSPPIFNLSQHRGLFQGVSSSNRWSKYRSFRFSISPSRACLGLIFP